MQKNEYNIQRSNDFYKTKGFDLVIIGVILLIAVSSFLWMAWGNIHKRSEKRTALIYQNGSLWEEVGLEEDKIIPILNGQMQIEIKAGRVRVANSDCPQHICMNMGWIQYSGQTIVCVPNQVLIEVKSVGSPFLDVVAY